MSEKKEPDTETVKVGTRLYVIEQAKGFLSNVYMKGRTPETAQKGSAGIGGWLSWAGRIAGSVMTVLSFAFLGTPWWFGWEWGEAIFVFCVSLMCSRQLLDFHIIWAKVESTWLLVRSYFSEGGWDKWVYGRVTAGSAA